MELKAGQRITAPFLPAPAEVKKFETRAGYFLLEVILDDGHHTYKPLRITDGQLAQIQILGGSPVALTEDAEDFFFLIEAHRIRLPINSTPTSYEHLPVWSNDETNLRLRAHKSLWIQGERGQNLRYRDLLTCALTALLG